MRRALSVVCLSFLVVLAACGSSGSSSGSAAAPSGPASTAQSGGSGSSGGDSSDFCTQGGKQLEDALASSTADLNGFLGSLTDPSKKAALATQVDQILNGFDQAVKQAPNEIRGDMNTVFQAIRPFFDQLKKADYDITKIDLTSLASLENNQSIEAASQRIADYMKVHCGIDVTSTSR